MIALVLERDPKMMLSRNAGREEIIEAGQAGVNGFLAMPFVPDSLQKKVVEERAVR